jgi:hypothetical protein
MNDKYRRIFAADPSACCEEDDGISDIGGLPEAESEIDKVEACIREVESEINANEQGRDGASLRSNLRDLNDVRDRLLENRI